MLYKINSQHQSKNNNNNNTRKIEFEICEKRKKKNEKWNCFACLESPCAIWLIGYPTLLLYLLHRLMNHAPPPFQTPHRMSMFFFRLHNLQRAEENKRKKRVEQQRQQQRQRRGAKVFKCVSDSTGHLTLAPSRLFERTPMSPSDSLDEIALQIPRWVCSHKPFELCPQGGSDSESLPTCVCVLRLHCWRKYNNNNTHMPAIEQLLPASYLWLFFFTITRGAQPPQQRTPGNSLEILSPIPPTHSWVCEVCVASHTPCPCNIHITLPLFFCVIHKATC